eukprot:GAHX01000293.1.p1 GENE.GAHX01000293.1~~GAHX01000293.1.p1  ORF type:complete len:108 (-),score=32.55 GAHX01000293.1:37-360(-)
MADLKTEQKILSLACVTLAESNKEITSDNIKKMLETSGSQIQDYLIKVFVEAFKTFNYKELKEAVCNAGISGGASAAAPAAAEEKKVEAVVEQEEEEEEDLDMDLFD